MRDLLKTACEIVSLATFTTFLVLLAS